MDFVRKGFYEVYANEELISQHSREDKAIIKAINQTGDVYVKYPDRLELIRKGNTSEGELNKVVWE